jgi:hypothetical protein
MSWTIVNFGKHKGKTLPQILFSDPDWFFWTGKKGVFKNKGTLNREADELNIKARHIKIPSRHGQNMVAEYIIDRPTMKFAHMELVPLDRPHHEGASPTFRKDVIDLSVPRQIIPYDKLGCSHMLSSVKYYLFGNESTRMTKKRCEDFFDNSDNFTKA